MADVLLDDTSSASQRLLAESVADATLELRAIQELRLRTISNRLASLGQQSDAINPELVQAMAIADTIGELASLHRYERRALSRRKMLLRRLRPTRW